LNDQICEFNELRMPLSHGPAKSVLSQLRPAVVGKHCRKRRLIPQVRLVKDRRYGFEVAPPRCVGESARQVSQTSRAGGLKRRLRGRVRRIARSEPECYQSGAEAKQGSASVGVDFRIAAFDARFSIADGDCIVSRFHHVSPHEFAV